MDEVLKAESWIDLTGQLRFAHHIINIPTILFCLWVINYEKFPYFLLLCSARKMWFVVITIVCHVWHAYRLHASHLLFWAQSCMQFAVLTYIGRLACYRFPFIASISEETCSFRQWLEIWHTNVGWTNCLNEKLLKFLTRFCSMEFDCSKEQSKLHNCVDVQFNLKHKIMCCEK